MDPICAEPRASDAAAASPDILFERLAPVPPRHPRSSYPMLPVVGVRGTGTPMAVDSRFLQPDAMFTPSGSAAILCALRQAGVGGGDEVQVPAYHCPTMIWPVQAAGAVPVLVPVEPDLSVTLAQLKLRASARTRAVLLPHFFGMFQPGLGEIWRWCDRQGIVLVEDCAHAFYGARGSTLPGAGGHFAIASTRKFFAGTEGGALVCNTGPLLAQLAAAPWSDEARCAIGTLQLAREYGGLPWQRWPQELKGRALEGAADEHGAIAEARPTPATPAEIDSAMARRQACRVTRALVHRERHEQSAGIRRARWQRWRALIDQLPGVDSFVDQLPAHVVPYVFAARLREPARVFPALKYAGVQVWRWDRLAVSDCGTSRTLALELVQLPCQQSLPDVAFESLLEHFSAILRNPGARA